MVLAVGVRLGPYEVIAPIGVGGMGEVYKARDLRLGRTVALKTLHAGAGASPEQRRRFEREAHAISALRHPHICTLYDVGYEAPTGAASTAEAVPFLVMEYLEGQTLAHKLCRGPLPIEEVFECGAQIADGLAHAHRHGVVHRDLKPGNIILTKAGAVLLDFGLAKPEALADTSGADTTTLTTQELATKPGEILGTVPYMAPEQLEGKKADARADLFAFGCVLYEMLTGYRAFDGPSRAAVVAAVLSSEPVPLSQRQPAAPPILERLVTKCLAKDPDCRWESAQDAALELRWLAEGRAALSGSETSSSRHRRPKTLALGAALLVGTVVGAGWFLQGTRRPPSGSFAMALPDGVEYARNASLAFSPDGTAIVYEAGNEGGTRLYWHDLNQQEGRPLAGTDGATEPFFSPGGEWLGFIRNHKVVKVKIHGGQIAAGSPAIELADAPKGRGVTWGDRGTILYTPGTDTGLWRVSSDGGQPREVTRPDPSKGEGSHRWPSFLPDGQTALFTILHESDRQDRSTVAAVSLSTGRITTIVHGGSYGRYVPPAHLVYARNGTLLAVSFDPQTLKTTGSPVALVNSVVMGRNSWLNAEFATSSSGSLAYAHDPSPQPLGLLVWVDRDGRAEPITSERRAYASQPRLAPDGHSLAVAIEDTSFTQNLWTFDLRERRWQQLTFAGDSSYPVWSPTADRIAFASNRDGAFNVYVVAADGDRLPDRLTRSANLQYPCSWSADGRFLAYREVGSKGSFDTWILPLPEGRPAWRWGPQGVDATVPAFSPDGRWIAYASLESGKWEAYVRPFPGPGPRNRISGANGGMAPTWSRDGREVLFLDGNRIMTTVVGPGPVLHPSPPTLTIALPFQLEVNPDLDSFGALTPDGRRVAVIQPAITSSIQHLFVILDCSETLKAQASAK